MRRFFLGLFLLILVWTCSGFYVVRGNERGVVRRFGAVVMNETRQPQLSDSGWHYDLPWPFSDVARVNFNALRTLTIGIPEPVDVDVQDFLKPASQSQQTQFLTGDKNILNLQIAVQYRIAEDSVADWLFANDDPALTLKNLTESVATDLISQAGVDFVHPLGLGELRDQLTRRVRAESRQLSLGIDVDEVSISAVYPPIRVKAYFVDVANARADRQKYINAALAYEQQTEQSARAEQQRIRDAVFSEQQQLILKARASSQSFRKLVAELNRAGTYGTPAYANARTLVLQREYLTTLEDLLSRVKDKILIDSERPADVTIFGTGNATE